MAVIEFSNVSKSFGEGTHRTDVLKNINLKVEEGEFLVLLGFSGTGKTTLINLMAGLEKPSTGTVTFKGQPIDGPGRERGVIFQNYSLMPWLTVNGNVRLALDSVFPKMPKAEKDLCPLILLPWPRVHTCGVPPCYEFDLGKSVQV